MRGLISLFVAFALLAGSPAIAQVGPGTPPSTGGGGSGCIPGGASGDVQTNDGAGGCAGGTPLSSLAPKASPVLTGAPTAPTPALGDSSTAVATTAYVKGQGYAPTVSPTLTGSPVSPWPSLSNIAPISSNWYLPADLSVTTGTSVTASRIVCTLQLFPFTVSIKALGTRTTTTLNGSNVSVAIYKSDGAGGTPGTLLAHTGSIAMGASAGLLSASTVETTPSIPAGFNWTCSNSDNTTVVFQAASNSISAWGASALIGDASQSNIDNGAALAVKVVFTAQTFGTWAAGGTYPWSASNALGGAGIVMYQAN